MAADVQSHDDDEGNEGHGQTVWPPELFERKEGLHRWNAGKQCQQGD